MSNDGKNEQGNLRGRVMALAVDFGTRARNVYAGIEPILESGVDHQFDAAEFDVIGKTWADAAAMLWSVLGSDPKHDKGLALVRVGFGDLAALIAREEQLTRRVAELEAKLSDIGPRISFVQNQNEQDIRSLYIAGGSSERLTVGRPWIDRAIAEGARITFDWSRASGYDDAHPTEDTLRENAAKDVHAVMDAGVFWLLAPAELSEGAATELGIAIAFAIAMRLAGVERRMRIVVSGPHARGNLFALLADEIHDTHEQAWEAVKPLVVGAAGRVTE